MRDKNQYNEYQRQYQLARYHRRRATAIVYLGGFCCICKSTDNLEIDHKNYEEKSFSISKLWSCSEQKFLSELVKCQLLCRKHHSQKTLIEDKERRPITHGKYWAAYKHKCDCDQCSQYKLEHAAARRIKRASVAKWSKAADF